MRWLSFPFVSPLIAWSFNCSLGRSVTWSTGPSVGHSLSVGQSLSCSVLCLSHWSVSPLLPRSVSTLGRLMPLSVSTSLGWSIVCPSSCLSHSSWSLGCTICPTVADPSVGCSAFGWSVLELVSPSVCPVVGYTFVYFSVT